MAKTIITSVDELIALYHILDNYSEFKENLNNLLFSNYNLKDTKGLDNISNGKKVIGARKIKKFYKQNKNVIDTINKYYNILDFINNNYNFYGNIVDNASMEYFYNYFIEHKNELDKILKVLERLKELGFNKFDFVPNADYTKEKQGINSKIEGNLAINYFDNMELIPNYDNDIVKYKTTNSNYKIILETFFNIEEKKVDSPCLDAKIELNSLVFDAKRLPESIENLTLFNKILSLKEEKMESCLNVQKAIDLSTSVDKLQLDFLLTSSIIEKVCDVKEDEELKSILLTMQEYLKKLRSVSLDFTKSVCENDANISEGIVFTERQLHLYKKYLNHLDNQ